VSGDSAVQLPNITDTSGPQARTIKVVAYINDAPVTLQLQAIAVLDENGHAINLDQSTQANMLDELRRIRALLEHQAGISLEA
jgi:hypothetical protein